MIRVRALYGFNIAMIRLGGLKEEVKDRAVRGMGFKVRRRALFRRYG